LPVPIFYNQHGQIAFWTRSAHIENWVVDAEPNGIMPPPGRGNGNDPELLDSPIGLFHYPSPGALLR